MNTKVLIEALLLFAISVLAIVEGWRLTFKKEIGQLAETIGAGEYIFGIGICMMLAAFVYFWHNWRKSPDIKKAIVDVKEIARKKENTVRVVSMILIYATYTWLIGFIGYVMATIFFFFLEFRIVGIKSWILNIVLSLAISALSYVVFVKWSNVVFPKGILFG